MINNTPPDNRPDDSAPFTWGDHRAYLTVLLRDRNEIVRRLNLQRREQERLAFGLTALNVISQLSPEDRSERMTVALEQIATGTAAAAGSDAHTANALDDHLGTLTGAMLFDRLSPERKAELLREVEGLN
jgi:hypothetical protein